MYNVFLVVQPDLNFKYMLLFGFRFYVSLITYMGLNIMTLMTRLVKVFAVIVCFNMDVGVRVAARQSTKASKCHNICRKRINVNNLIILEHCSEALMFIFLIH